MTAQEALDNHPTATKAHVNAEGEWHFSTPPNGFIVAEILVKGEVRELKIRDLKPNEMLESVDMDGLKETPVNIKEVKKQKK